MYRLFFLGLILSYCSLTPLYTLAQQINYAQYQKTPSGVMYRFLSQVPKQRKAVVGDMVDFTMAIRSHKDSLLRPNASLQFMVQSAYPQPSITPVEVFNVAAEKDSIEVLISIDSLRNSSQGASLPPSFEPKTFLKYYIKILKIRNTAEIEKEKIQQDSLQTAKEITAIQQYVSQKKLTAQRTKTGLHWVVLQQGTGIKPQAGQTVVVHYTGMLLNGSKFDSSVDRGQPFDFPLGAGRVIRGWDEGIALLNVGTKALLLIPSALGYGERGAGANIPPKSVLVFEVELLGVK